MKREGFVYIVGAGPGDPDLITVKGRRCVRRADVILHDRLIHPDLLKEARPNALLIDADRARKELRDRSGFDVFSNTAGSDLFLNVPHTGRELSWQLGEGG